MQHPRIIDIAIDDAYNDSGNTFGLSYKAEKLYKNITGKDIQGARRTDQNLIFVIKKLGCKASLNYSYIVVKKTIENHWKIENTSDGEILKFSPNTDYYIRELLKLNLPDNEFGARVKNIIKQQESYKLLFYQLVTWEDEDIKKKKNAINAAYIYKNALRYVGERSIYLIR